MLIMDIAPLTHENLDTLLREADPHVTAELHKAYFTEGSLPYVVLVKQQPVFAAGIVNLQWKRGEAWMLPTPWFRNHVKTCLKLLIRTLPSLARNGGFVRVQATCVEGVSAKLFYHLGFRYEGTLQKFGPNGEVCRMFARIFDL